MAEVDASIALQGRPVQLDNPLDTAAKGLQLKQLGLQTQQAQQDYDDSQQLRSIYARNIDPTTGQLDQDKFTRDGLSAGLGDKVVKIKQMFLANQKTQADIDETKAKGDSEKATAAKTDYDTHLDKLGHMAGALNDLAQGSVDPNTGQRTPATAQDITNRVHNAVDSGIIDAATGAQIVRNIPANPNQIQGYIQSAIANTQTAQQAAELAKAQAEAAKARYQNTGGALTPINSTTGQPTGEAPIPLTASPDSVLSANTSRANNAATIGKDLTVAANKLSANGFSQAQGDVLGSLAAHGISLPAGLRSKEQIRSTVQALIDANPDKSPDDIAQLVGNGQINFKSDTKAATVAAGQEGKLSTAVNELGPAGDLVMKYSSLVPRGNFVPANKLIQMADSSISDPNLIRLKAALTQLHNAYNVVGGRGGSDAAARHHVDDLFASANGPEGMQALVDAIKSEGDIAKGAAAQASHVGGTTTAPPSAAPTGAVVPIKSEADYAALPSGTPFIAPDGSHRVKP